MHLAVDVISDVICFLISFAVCFASNASGWNSPRHSSISSCCECLA